MGAPKGNTFAKGNKGGSRKSAYDEVQDAEWHHFAWQKDTNLKQLRKKIKSGVYSGRDMAALMLLEGNKYIVAKFLDKLVPSKEDPGGDINFIFNMINYGDKDRLTIPVHAEELPNPAITSKGQRNEKVVRSLA